MFLAYFFRGVISELSGPIVTKLCHMSVVTVIYKIWSEIWGFCVLPPKKEKIATQNIKIAAQFRTTSRLDRQDIVDRKTALETIRSLPYMSS